MFHRLRGLISSILGQVQGGALLFIGVFLVVALLTRIVLLAMAAGEVSWNASLVASFAWGLLFDLGAAAWLALPIALGLTLVPRRWLAQGWLKALIFTASVVISALLGCAGLAELLFWDEFGVRANFIAVDYLVYTTEVLGNIRESYNVPLLLGSVGLGALGLTVLAWRTRGPETWFSAAANSGSSRFRGALAWTGGTILAGSLISSSWLPAFDNNFNRELGKNGFWSLVTAYKMNELAYESFYRTEDPKSACAELREQLVEDGSFFLSVDEGGDCDSTRFVSNEGPELRVNVIQITVESLDAKFLAAYGSTDGLTPNLDAIAADSLLFENCYATGTRTVRGMEALTLSLPPTPGRSIVKRPKNERLFTLGSVFRRKGYETTFLYGGHGYFDNMNYYFAENGFEVVDRSRVAAEDVTFANAWGACDEDLFDWTLREADAAWERKTPFHHFVMTTSNHRPYTFPEGRIDLPSRVSGRPGAVKYTDHAIGEFLRKASEQPWYRNTVFVIVGDHCASSAGRTRVDLVRYRIPLLVYAPGGQIEPGRISTLMSQMDYAPTLLGLLNWSYPTRFLGHDVRRIGSEQGHALLGNYQLLGHLEQTDFVLLGPRGSAEAFAFDPRTYELSERSEEETAESEAIAYYQEASRLFTEGRYREIDAEAWARLEATARLRQEATSANGM